MLKRRGIIIAHLKFIGKLTAERFNKHGAKEYKPNYIIQ